MAAAASAITALLDFSDPLSADAPRLRYAFANPRMVLQAHSLDQVQGVLAAVQLHAAQGRWCVGYVSYEAAPAFDAALVVHASTGPLAWFAVFENALPWPEALGSHEVRVDWQALMPRAVFDSSMQTLHEAIAQGELYQVNLTTQMQGQLSHAAGVDAHQAALSLFASLLRAQPNGYAALIDTGDSGQVLSVSPELFFDWQAPTILARPMKGTARRGDTPHEDEALAQGLRSSAKERSENVMIVDLLRNDISRVAEPFSVKVPRLFHTQALPTVWQMTSDVQATTRAGTTLVDVFSALFPCGSVTGAPKVQAMQKIHQLEPHARGVYCGALGVVQPGGRATFNVPIRTVTLQGQRAHCGIGSGITADATAQGEWQEWVYKQAFVQRASQAFSLLETLALKDGVLRHRAAHLARMQAAADHFGVPWDASRVDAALEVLTQSHPSGLWRVRLLMDAQGQPQAHAFALEPHPEFIRLALAKQPLLEAHSEFVRFKTTRRAHYDAFSPTEPGVFDTILWNSAGEITEGTRGNLAFCIEGRWMTPPLTCGLLNGVGRAAALSAGRVVEGVVRLADLERATEMAFINSLRGWLPARKNTLKGVES